MKGKTLVLVVEDDHFLSDIYKVQFLSHGCEVKVAEDGNKALEILKTFKPDIILLDLIMPGMDGFDFLEAFAKHPDRKKVKVYVLSNLGQESEKQRCQAYGIKKFFVKTDTSFGQIINEVLA